MSGAKLTVTLLTRSLHAGGAERLFCNIAEGLKDQGHRVSVTTFYPGGHFSEELSDYAIPHRDAAKKSRWDIFGFLLRLARVLRHDRPDVIYGFLPTSNILLVLLKPFLGGAKVVWGVGALNEVADFHDWPSRTSLRLEAALSNVPDLIIANSAPVRDLLVRRKFPAAKIALIPNGVNLDKFTPAPDGGAALRETWNVPRDALVVGRVGRLHPVKGYPDFLDAAARMGRANVYYVIVGDGDDAYTATLKHQVRDLGIEHQVIWAGTHQDMPAVYSAFDVMVSSSVEESSPHVAIEAMACGVPCVVTDVGDSADLVGDTGYVVPASDPGEMAAALAKIADLSAQMRRDLGARARQRMGDHYAEAALIERIEKTFQGLLENGAEG